MQEQVFGMGAFAKIMPSQGFGHQFFATTPSLGGRVEDEPGISEPTKYTTTGLKFGEEGLGGYDRVLKKMFQWFDREGGGKQHVYSTLSPGGGMMGQGVLAGEMGKGDVNLLANTIKESADNFDFSTSEIDVYRMAREKERKCMEFYLEKALEVGNQAQQNVFMKLADEEEKHYRVLDNICDFVSEPECYLENAEFVHIDNYPI